MTTQGKPRKAASTPPPASPGPSTATNPNEMLNIDNSAADIVGNMDNTPAGAADAELPPLPGVVPGLEDAGVVPDSEGATTAQVGAELPPPAQAAPEAPAFKTPPGLAEVPLDVVPGDVTRVGAAPLPTDNTGQVINQDAEGTPLNKKAKYTDKSVWKDGVQAEVRAAIMAGKLVRRMTGESGAPVYRFYH